MAENQLISKRHVRFSMRTLLLMVLVLAALLWCVPEAFERYRSVPIADAIVIFNTRAQNSSVGRYEPPLTEREVIAAIMAQLPALKASSQVNSIYQKIASTRRLPEGAGFYEIPGFQPRNGPQQVVWWINLDVSTGKNSGYGLRIRETNDPVAARNGTAGTYLDKVQLSEVPDGKFESN